jgi:aminoglycoside 2'-N-acetyltransferase I
MTPPPGAVQLAHTADLGPQTLAAARELLYDVFDDMTEQDWEHSLGGVHAIAWLDGEVVGHAAVVQRRLLHNGRALRTGYVEGVGVREDLRGQGYGGALMDPLERVIRSAYDLGALGSTDEAVAFYSGRGWVRWSGPTYALTPDGVVRTNDDDGGVFVLPVSVLLDLSGSLTCDWRDGDPW